MKLGTYESQRLTVLTIGWALAKKGGILEFYTDRTKVKVIICIHFGITYPFLEEFSNMEHFENGTNYKFACLLWTVY